MRDGEHRGELHLVDGEVRRRRPGQPLVPVEKVLPASGRVGGSHGSHLKRRHGRGRDVTEN